MSNRIGIALIGATGTVGQKVIKLLEGHPQFFIQEVVASERSVGTIYGERVHWRQGGKVPKDVAGLKLKSFEEVTSSYAISSIPSEQARMIEGGLAEKGVHVISNTSVYRMDKDVPLVVPEINEGHFSMVSEQKTKGKIITNPNCSTVFLALGLAPIYRKLKIKNISVFTLQAISGAGYPGVASSDILGNIIPNIGGEEEKIESEVQKILGGIAQPADFEVFASVNRVPVDHGHTITMHISLNEATSKSELQNIFEVAKAEFPEAYELYSNDFHPQPKFHLSSSDNKAHIGRIRVNEDGTRISVNSLGHNLVRGAAGAAILNLEKFHNFLNS